jgi:hypothetical protein
MSFKKMFAYVAGTIAVLVLLSGINIALPTTIKVTYAADGKPVPDAFVVSYLAIRGGFHNFVGGQSLSRVTKTNVQGEAVFGLDFTWVFMNSFQDYKSKILVYKPFYAPAILMEAFDISRPIVTIASPKVEAFSVKPHNIDPVKKSDSIINFGFEVRAIQTEKNFRSGLNEAFYTERRTLDTSNPP